MLPRLACPRSSSLSGLAARRPEQPLVCPQLLPTLKLRESPLDAPPESSLESGPQIQEALDGLAVEHSLSRLDSAVEMNCRRTQEMFSLALRELSRWQHWRWRHQNFSAEVLAPLEAFPLPARR